MACIRRLHSFTPHPHSVIGSVGANRTTSRRDGGPCPRILGVPFALVLATYIPLCTPRIAPTTPTAPLSELWREPTDLANRNLRDGPWGASSAPDPLATYRFVRLKERGVNPGVVVMDSLEREWHVKQHARNDAGAEGPVEVVLSRVLSAVGYHQPPVYYLPSFTMTDTRGTDREPGGRFRLSDPSMKDAGEWSWQENPFVGQRPLNGLLVILLLFNSTDLKNSNNTLYEVKQGGQVERWYVVRDLGSALGQTGRFAPKSDDPESFERATFIKGVSGGFVEFGNRGFHQELFRQRITTDDVAWAARLLSELSDKQWHEAFEAANYAPAVTDRFLRKIRANLAQARDFPGVQPQ